LSNWKKRRDGDESIIGERSDSEEGDGGEKKKRKTGKKDVRKVSEDY
jgi:hypothetical protein